MATPIRSPLMHFAAEAQLVTNRQAWAVRAKSPLPKRIVMTAAVIVLRLSVVRWVAVCWTLRTFVDPRRRILGTGREAVVLAARDPAVVEKFYFGTGLMTAPERAEWVAERRERERLLARYLEVNLLETDYIESTVGRAPHRPMAVGLQDRVSIVDGLLAGGDLGLSDTALRWPAEPLLGFCDRVDRLRDDAGMYLDLLGIGNVVLIDGRDEPVVIDASPVPEARLATTHSTGRTRAVVVTERVAQIREAVLAR